MSRRAQFLEVLGIGTEWVPRRLPEAVAADVAEAMAEPDVAVVALEPDVARAVVPEPIAAPVLEAIAAPIPEPISEPEPIPEPEVTAATVPEPVAVALAEEVAAEVPAAEVPNPPVIMEASVTPTRADAIAALDWNALQQHVAACTACGLCETRNNTVFGVGDPNAEWMLVGEAPGENEDLQGEPFVGQAGKLLDNMLRALGLARGRNVFIANVLKCRPPGNRDPQPPEVLECEPYLRRQIALVRPKVIVVLGRFAAQALLRTTTPIGRLRGQVHQYEGIPVVVTYHPAYLLRSLTEKARAWDDLCLAREVHDRAGAGA